MKFLYYLAAIGNPNLEIKIDILKNNLIMIYQNLKQNYDIIINCYEEDIRIEDIIKCFKFTFLDNIYVHNKKGILSELWLTNNYHDKIKEYNYILFILDDVKIINIDIHKLIFIKNKFNIEFLSPKVLNSTWQYMKHPKYKNLVLTNRVEIFCLLLTEKDFEKFMSLNSIENPNIWGIDYLMSHFNIKTAIYHNNVVEHALTSQSNHEIAIKQMCKLLNKYGYTSDIEIINKYGNEIVKKIDNINY